MKKTPSDLNLWQEFIATINTGSPKQHAKRHHKHVKIHKGHSALQQAPNSELWNSVMQHIENRNHHRNAYVKNDIIQQKVNLPTKPPFVVLNSDYTPSFNEYENTPTLANSLDRQEKKHYAKLAPSNIFSIDLHGYTIKQAYEHFKLSIQIAAAQQKKVLKVITGKGRGVKNTQTIQNSFMSWTSEPGFNRYIAKVRQSQPQDGGSGAYLVFLKKLNKN